QFALLKHFANHKDKNGKFIIDFNVKPNGCPSLLELCKQAELYNMAQKQIAEVLELERELLQKLTPEENKVVQEFKNSTIGNFNLSPLIKLIQGKKELSEIQDKNALTPLFHAAF